MFQFQNLGQENQLLKESFAYPIHNNEALTFLLSYQDNLEEYALLNESDLAYWKQAAGKAAATSKAVVAGFGGTTLGDVAFIPAMGLKHPKGIRSVAEW